VNWRISLGALWRGQPLDGARSARVPAEILGWSVAAIVGVAVVAHAAVAQSQMLYSDGDSVLTVLVTKSLDLGQPQDWAMSPVLFIPEIALYAAISALGLGVRTTLTINAVINFMALFATIRVLAGRWRVGNAPILTSLAAFSIYASLALLEGESGRQGFQLASLLATTTYYSSTLLGAVLTIGVSRRIIDDAGKRRIAALGMLISVSLLSTLNNPLFVGWAVIPVVAAVGILAIRQRIAREWAVGLLAAVAGGAVVGYAARVFFSHIIVADSGNYLYPGKWTVSLNFYLDELLQTPSTAAGLIWLVLIVSAFAGCAVALWVALRKSLAAESLVYLVSLGSPIITVVGAIATGTEANRYLQSVFLIPVACLAAFPVLAFGRAKVRSAITWAATTISMAALIGAVLTVPRFAPVAVQADTDLACVVSWVEKSGQTGGGQYWSVRAPMAYVHNPDRLVQIDANFNRYDWLVNRAAPRPAGVTFLIETVRDSPYVYPGGHAPGGKTINCGPYQILDFGTKKIPLGPAHF
jgi:hypothetical protein